MRARDEPARHDRSIPESSRSSRLRYSAAAVDDEAVRQVVGGNRDRDAISGNHFDVKATQPATDTGEERVALVALDAKVSTRERFNHFALNLDQIVSCHSMTSLPESRSAPSGRCVLRAARSEFREPNGWIATGNGAFRIPTRLLVVDM